MSCFLDCRAQRDLEQWRSLMVASNRAVGSGGGRVKVRFPHYPASQARDEPYCERQESAVPRVLFRPGATPARSRSAWRLAVLLCSLLSLSAGATNVAQYAHSLEGAVLYQHDRITPVPGAGAQAFNVAVIQRLQTLLANKARLRELPFTRGIRLLAQARPAMMSGLYRIPEWETQYRWIGPVFSDEVLLYESSKRPLQLCGIHAARQLSVCALQGSDVEARLYSDSFRRVEPAASNVACLKQLAAGRVLLVAIPKGELAAKLQEAGMRVDQLRPSGLVLMRADSYIAASLATPQVEVDAWNHALRQLRASPEYEQLHQQYWP